MTHVSFGHGYRTLTRILAGTFLAMLVLFGANVANAQEATRGGVLEVATPADPETLDMHATTADATAVAANHWIEPLVAFDEGYVPQPHLASSVDLSDDGMTYTFTLRDGVTFHDGSSFDAADAVASLDRWTSMSVRGDTAAPFIDGIRAADDLTVVIELNRPFAPLLNLMANPNNGGVIYPSEVVEQYPDTPIPPEGQIGTGPYRFVEWLPDRFVRVERYDDYSPVDAESSAWAGARTSYVDEIRFIPVPDVSTRIAGVESGEYDFADRVNRDSYDRLESNRDVDTVVIQPDGWMIFLLNKREGPLTNTKLRNAIYAAFDMGEILRAAAGPEQFWNLEHNYMVGDTPFHTEVGADSYNLADPELAGQLAEEAGYDGEPIRWLVSTSHQEHFNGSTVAVEQLRNAGFNVEMQPVEWATLLDRRQEEGVWEIFTTTGGFVPDPALLTVITDRYPGWWEDEQRSELVERLHTATNLDERVEIWKELQAYIYDVTPSVFVGELFGLQIKSAQLHNVVPSRNPFFWNTWLD